MQVLAIVVIAIVGAFVPSLLLRLGVRWRIAMLAPTLGTSLIVALMFYSSSLATWLSVIFWLLITMSFYISMLSVWWVAKPALEQHDMRW